MFDHEPSTKLRFRNDSECGGRVSSVSFAWKGYQMQFDDKFTVQIFRFKHIVTGIEHEPSKEEVLEQT